MSLSQHKLDSILAPIVARGGRVHAIGGKIRFSHLPDGLTPNEAALLKENKGELLISLAEWCAVLLPSGATMLANPMDESDVYRHLAAEGSIGADELPGRGVAA